MTLVCGSLNATSYSSMYSSLHEFITNPVERAINRSLPGMEEVWFSHTLKINILSFIFMLFDNNNFEKFGFFIYNNYK